MSSSAPQPSIDVGHAIDSGPWSRFQQMGVLLAALSIVLDGFNGQLIGFAIPVIMKEMGASREAFAPVVAAGLFGMAFGSAFAGYICDRYGRRIAIVGSVLLFGAATSAVGLSQNLMEIGLFRFLAGLGIGGALPSASTIAAELTPVRRRTLAITATIVCVPLGGMLAGFYAGFVLVAFGWRILFGLGGAFAVALGILLIALLPESPRFLVRRPQRWPELRLLLARMSRPAPEHTRFTDMAEQSRERRDGFAALLEPDRIRDTLALWVAFFLSLLAVYTAFSWLPAMLTSEGLDVAAASAGLTAYNFGGVIGALLCAFAIARYGSRWPIALSCAGGAASAFALQAIGVKSTSLLIAGLGLHGLFVNAAQTTMFALCAHVYPTNVRASGAAASLALGRLGSITSGFIGAAVISGGGAKAYFGLLGLSMTGVTIALMLVRNHIPGVGASALPREAGPASGDSALVWQDGNEP